MRRTCRCAYLVSTGGRCCICAGTRIGRGLLTKYLAGGFVDIARFSPQQRNARPGSSDRSLGSTRSPKLSSAIRTARYHSLATSHCPAAIRLHLPPKPERRAPVILQLLVDRQFDEIHLQPATHPRAHQFRNTSNLFYGFFTISSDHHQCFMQHRLPDSRPNSKT